MSSVDFVCTQEQSKLVEQVREQTGSKEPQHVLLRFLVARNWDAAAASEQYTTDVRWRQEQNVGQYRRPVQGLHGSAMNSWLNSRPDSMLTVCGVELWPDLRQMVLGGQEGAWIYFGAPCMAFGHDRQGRPVHLQRAGIASGKRFADACTHFGKDWQKAFIARNIYFQELQAARMEEATQRFGRLVTQQVVIMDLAGMSFRPDPRSLTTFRDLAAIMSHHYPETLYKHFIINAPRVFTAIWRVIRSWLDPNTREKVHVLGTTYAPTLLQHIDADQLPVEFGGTNPYQLPKVNSIEEGEALWQLTVQEFNTPQLLAETGWVAQPGVAAVDVM